MKIILFIILNFLSFHAFSGTHIAQYTWTNSYSVNASAQDGCSSYNSTNPEYAPYILGTKLAENAYKCFTSGGFDIGLTTTKLIRCSSTDSWVSAPNTVGDVECSNSCTISETWSYTTNSCQTALTCVPPQIINETGTACVTDCSTQNGKLTGSLFSASDSPTYCYNGCTVQVNNSVCVTSGCAIDGKYTNTSCSTETATTPETPESKCLAKGMSYGTINDQVVCVESGTAGTPPIKSKDNNVSNTTTNDGSGDVETTKEVSREYDPLTGKVTTTTTTTTPSGTTTETKQEDKKGFCEENPDVTICKGGSFSGSCANSFSCDGDAVQCATALHLHRARCKDSQDLQSEFATQIQEGMDIMNGENSTEANAIKNRDSSVTTTIDLENEISESGDIAFSAECFDDLTITVLGNNLVIPISSICQYLEMMGYILLALAYLSALRIVGIF